MSANVAPSMDHMPAQSKSTALKDALQAVASLFQEQSLPAQLDAANQRLWLLGLTCAAAIVRFWGLGSVGLHGDEETMALAVQGILKDGWPILPSGMFYPRGLTQVYLMAASVSVFGESEWALRLPSVLCGIALVGLAYLAGRRFLRPQWNLAFTACVALLPSLIELSQTARMYIFLVAAVMASMACIFEWERTDRTRWLVGAVAALVVGLDMHVLAIAAIVMFLVPGITRGDLRRLTLGAAGAATVVLAYFLIEFWLATQYPTPPADIVQSFGSDAPRQSLALREFDFSYELAFWLAGLVIGVLAWRVTTLVSGVRAMVCTMVLLFAGVVLQVVLHYHLAAICYLAGGMAALRYAASPKLAGRLAILFAAVMLLGVLHAALLAPKAGTAIRVVGALVGQPSVWPYVRIAELSPVAGVLTAALLAWGFYRFARSEPVPHYWLLAALGVWAPLLALGMLEWNPPPRYTTMSLAPMLLCAFAAAQDGVDHILARWSRLAARVRATAAAAGLALLTINPPAVATAIASGYRTHPDHKGAAEFIRSQHIRDEDVLIAEDVLQQTYYLGRVDYWLIGPHVAKQFVVRLGDKAVDFYTHTPILVSPAMLDDVLARNRDKRIFVIGTGEGWIAGRRPVREALEGAIESERFDTVYTGRDGLTRVLRAVPGTVRPSDVTRTQSQADGAALAAETPTRHGSKSPPR